MATALSGTFNSDFKAYFTYSTSQSNTSFTVAVSAAGLYQSCSWSQYPWKTTLSATGYSSTTATKGSVYWTSGYHALISSTHNYSYSRGTSARTVTVSATTTKNVSGGGSGTASVSFTVPALPSYTISYNANGGTGAPGSQTKVYGTNLTLSSTRPTRADSVSGGVTTTYTFLGWAESSTATAPQYSPGGTYTKNAAATLYAVWSSQSSCLISFNSNGGTEIPAQEKPYGQNINITSQVPVKNGYTFLGWTLTNGSTTINYSPGSVYSSNESVVLFAVWQPWTHTVAFNGQGGSNLPANLTKTTDQDLFIPSTIPTRTGYLFRKWNTNADGTGTTYYPNQSYDRTQNGGTYTLYAIWSSADILIYRTGKVQAITFTEGETQIGMFRDGTFETAEIVETNDVKITRNGKVYAKEFIER